MAASILTLATSLTKTAIFRPSLLRSRCESAVVLPAPRKPPSNVVGGESEVAATEERKRVNRKRLWGIELKEVAF